MEKTIKRIKLEYIEEAIKNSWYRDLDKTKEMNEFIQMQEVILSSSSIAEYFDNVQSDIEYFSTKFTKSVLSSLLQQPCVFGTNGDDIALNLLTNYLLLWMKFHKDPGYSQLWDEVRELLKLDSTYYKGSNTSGQLYNPKKFYDFDQFNEKIPKSPELLNFKVGDECDVFVDVKVKKYFADPKIWVRGKILEVNDIYYTIRLPDSKDIVQLRKGSLMVIPSGTMTKDWDFRRTLNQYDVIDCFDRGQWFPSTVTAVNHNGGEERILTYRIGFRLYVDSYPEWKKYCSYWSAGDFIRTDSLGRKFIGDVEHMDEDIPFYSKRIQKLGTKTSTNYQQKQQSPNRTYFNGNRFYSNRNDFLEEEHLQLPMDKYIPYKDLTTNKKNYIIGNLENFSYYYALLLEQFAKEGGYEEIIKTLQNKPTSDEMFNIFSILRASLGYLHKDFFVEYGEIIDKSVFEFINELPANDMRNLKKDLIDLIIKVLSLIRKITNQSGGKLSELAIAISLKMIKTSIFDKRLQGVKSLNDYIKSNRDKEEVLSSIIKLIKENDIINEIFGPNSHSQIVSKANDIIELLLQKDELTEDEIKLILSGTQKGDLEGKLTILNLIKELSINFKPKHIQIILNNIYNQSTFDLNLTEIDLVYDLSMKGDNEENIQKCITFFTNCLLHYKSLEDEKTDQIIAKLINITNKGDKYVQNVIGMCVDCLKQNKHAVLSYKMLNKYLYEMNNKEIIITPVHELVENGFLLTIYEDNFKTYKEKAREIFEKDPNTMLIDDFTHLDNIKVRCEFLKVIIQLYPDFNFVGFLIEILLKNPVKPEDREFFFKIATTTLEQMTLGKGKMKLLSELFELFKENQNKKEGNVIGEMSKSAFNVFIAVFLGINQEKGYITRLPFYNDTINDLSGITLEKSPDELEGFEILWNIIFDSSNPSIMNEGIEIVNNLFKKNDEMNKLLNKCTNLLQKEAKDLKNIQQIKKCFTILKLILLESEIEGTGNIKSHFNLCKRRLNSLTVCIRMAATPDINANLYLNTTVSEIKSICSQALTIPTKYINFQFTAKDSNPKYPNSVSLFDILPNKDIDGVSLTYSSTPPHADLIDKLTEEPNPAFLAIINEWFNMFSEENTRMTKETCAEFVSNVTTNKDSVKTNDPRVTGFMQKYDIDNKGYIERDSFLNFYIEAARTKPSVVWENLNAMNIRYDLHNREDPIETTNVEKTKLPRFTLGNDLEFIKSLFSLFSQAKDPEIEHEVFEFLFGLYTNEAIYNKILDNNEDDIEGFDNEENLIKMLYSMQIMESFIEDLELSNKDPKMTVNSLVYEPFDEINGKSRIEEKKEWIVKFIKKKQYEKMVKNLEKLISRINSNKTETDQPNEILIKCVELNLKIVKDIFKANLGIISKQENENSYSSPPFFPKKGKRTSYDCYISQFSSLSMEELSSLLKSKQLNSELLTADDYLPLCSLLISFLNQCLIPSNTSTPNANIIYLSYEFVLNLLTYIQNEKFWDDNLKALFKKSLTHPSKDMQKFFFKILNEVTILAYNNQNYDFIMFIFSTCSTLFNEIKIGNSSESTGFSSFALFFDYFSALYEIVNNIKVKNQKFSSNDNTSEDFLIKIYDLIYEDLRGESGKELSSDLFVGFIKILTKACNSDEKIRDSLLKYKRNDEEVINLLIRKIILNANADKKTEIQSATDKADYIPIESIKSGKTNRLNNAEIKRTCYSFILSLIKNTDLCVNLFVEMNNMKEKEENDDDFNAKHDMMVNQKAYDMRNKGNSNFYSNYYNKPSGKSEGHVGLKNLGCICYMNSIMQQMYMVPTFRFAIMQSDDHVEVNAPHNIDDNVLHQLQKMYTYLYFSEKEYYNPKEFCYSFKDFDGRPTNTMVQQDSQEFLNAFCDKIEECLKKTNMKYIVNNVFVGRTCSQVICDACGNVSNRFEDFYNLTLEVANMKTLNDSLNKLVLPEKIDDFNCEACNKKVTITKRTSLCDLPNVLILHLKRFYMNYDIEHTEKNNSKLEFPLNINLKKYCIEELMHNKDANYETDEIYYKQDEYYEYELKGVNVHMGSADGGHYFSFIDVRRDGKGNELICKGKDDSVNWLKFNDSNVSKFSLDSLASECFGGTTENSNGYHYENCQNAYLLVYERRKKTPLKILEEIQPQNNNDENIFSFKEEERNKLKKLFDISRSIHPPIGETNTDTEVTPASVLREGNDMNLIPMSTIETMLSKLIFFDCAKNEYFKYINFYDIPKLVPIKYYKEVIADNNRFQKYQNNDDSTEKFFESITSQFQSYIERCKGKIKLSKNIKLSSLMNVVIRNIIEITDQANWNIQQRMSDISTRLSSYITLLEYCISESQDCLNIFVSSFIKEKNITLIFSMDKTYVPIMTQVKNILLNIITEYNNKDNSAIAENLVNCILDQSNAYGKERQVPFYELLYEVMKYVNEDKLEMLFNNKYISHLVSSLIKLNSLRTNDISTYNISQRYDENDESNPRNKPQNQIIIDIIYYMLKRTILFNANSLIPDSHKTEKDKRLYRYDDDLSEFRLQSLIDMIYQIDFVFFVDLMKLLQINNKDFIDESMMELCDYFEGVNFDCENGEEIQKLFNAMYEMLDIKDGYQFRRYTLLLGYPSPIVDESGENANYPIYGLKLMKSKNDSYMRFISQNHFNDTNCVLAKLFEFEDKINKNQNIMTDNDIELFITLIFELLKRTRNNFALFKYLYLLPCRSLSYDNCLDELIDIIKTQILKLPTESQSKFTSMVTSYLKDIEPKITIISKQQAKYYSQIQPDPENDMDIYYESENEDSDLFTENEINEMNWFNGFRCDYIANELVREEISHVCNGEGLTLLRIEYFSTIAPIDYFHPSKTEIQFGKETQESSNENDEGDAKIDETDNSITYDIRSRKGNEKLFMRLISTKAHNTDKKIIMVNTALQNEKCYNTLTRYVVTNSSIRSGILNLVIKWQKRNISMSKQKNFFIPEKVRDKITSNHYRDVFLFYKFISEIPSEDTKQIGVNIDIKFNNNSTIPSSAKYGGFA